MLGAEDLREFRRRALAIIDKEEKPGALRAFAATYEVLAQGFPHEAMQAVSFRQMAALAKLRAALLENEAKIRIAKPRYAALDRALRHRPSRPPMPRARGR